MDLSNVSRLDSHILLGIINEKLRLECGSLEDLVSTYEIDVQNVREKLSSVGYTYDPLTNQFKAS
ncbi:DUF4250 domain-containing protein [Vibrio sp.]|uniref:DUF4250 domain-containing protein n=1 Tax=Vibrio viridaestus TaxID=2487322 RepID=A0A3N9TH56_9VIBR|nr:DUF4250 domain-containing protein [Vibrio viridaestus]MDC0609651.1 DUF4250 domain-containing protein [Vibrio sp.]RQW63360.1 DUF4250 domain-containing protein [Vibrio viridaestus]